MRQAIEEGFILDVLKNYTSYKLAFRLAHDGKEMDEVEVERSKAMSKIMRWVRLHPYNISQKVQVNALAVYRRCRRSVCRLFISALPSGL